MVKEKAIPRPGKKTAGRRPGPPEDVRTERLVVRMHPDMFSVLTEKAKFYGVSRSQYVERILIGYLNMQADIKPLDNMGRHIKDPGLAKTAQMGPGEAWAAFGRRNMRLLGLQAEQAATAAGVPIVEDDD
jgi:hypothetical protein